MSYSTHRRDALDPARPLPDRLSHARSLAMLMGEKYRVPRGDVLDLVRRACGVDLTAAVAEADVVVAVRALDRIKAAGMGAAVAVDAGPGVAGVTIKEEASRD